MDIKLFVATKAFIINEGKVLILRESSDYKDGGNAGRFDVVGGRVKPGERFDDSLLREIKEETGLTARIERAFHTDEWRPMVRDEQWQIVGTYFVCHVDSREVVLSEDHNEYQWIDPKNYASFELIPNLQDAFQAYLAIYDI